MKKPTSLKWIAGIAWFQLAIACLLFMTLIACFAVPASEGFWLGWQNGFVRAYSSAQDVHAFGAREAGESTFHVLFAVMLSSGCLVCISRRKRTGLIVFLSLNIVFTLASKGLPILTVVALILALRKSVTAYFNQKEAGPGQPLPPPPILQ